MVPVVEGWSCGYIMGYPHIADIKDDEPKTGAMSRAAIAAV